MEQRPSTLLIVDDTPDNLTVLMDMLTPAYHVRAASSGVRALVVAASAPQPDLILLDVMMPDMDGYETLAELRRNPATRDIPVVFVTAMDDTAAEERGLELGAVDYITKPLRPAIVLARVRTQLELKQARDRLRDQNNYLEAEIGRRLHENQQIQDMSIRVLASLAETRDPETGNHLRRTQAYVRTLAESLCDHPRFADFIATHGIEALAKSAPLHDIGKVGIPDHILLKPGKLTAEEWAIMQTHTTLGTEAISHAEHDADVPLEFLRLARDITLYHHEKWDGSGYPHQLAGEAIPVVARLMALADVFDALISPRPYKPALTLAEARAIILSERARHFDPDIVDAFSDRFDRFAEIARRYHDVG